MYNLGFLRHSFYEFKDFGSPNDLKSMLSNVWISTRPHSFDFTEFGSLKYMKSEAEVSERMTLSSAPKVASGA